MYKLLLLFCLYIPFQVALNPAQGVDLASGRVFILILALMWLISGLKNRRVYVPARIQAALILSFLFLSVFSLFWANNTDWGTRKLLFLLSIFPIYFISAAISKSGFNRIKIIKFLVWGAGLAAVIGIVQFLSQFFIGLDQTAALWRTFITPVFLGQTFSQAVNDYPSWLVNIGGHDYLRAFATFPDPHMFSFYLGLALPLAVSLYSSLRKKTYLIFAAVIFLADLLTFSRGGYLGLIAGLIFLVLYFAINKKISIKKILVGFILAIVAFVSVIISPVGQRFASSFNAEEGSNIGRYENWSQAINIIEDNPLGVGIGNYAYKIDPTANYRTPIYAHNLYLDIAAETGIINALIFVLILIFSVRRFILKAKKDSVYFGGAAGLVIFSAHSIFDTAIYSVQVLPLLLIIIALSSNNNVKDN
ncbi:MAG: O-antigen ligase family protein [Parcubacteria group bacterium]